MHALSAIDTALWDLMAKRRRLPLWRLLGGHDPKVPAYAGGIDLQFPLEQLLRQTEDNLAKGFRAIKMKVGRERLSEDVARVGAMRELLGPDLALMVDANMRWRADVAIRAARALAPHQVTWLEEPTIPDDVQGHVRIAREGGLPIAAGENLHSLYEFQALIEAGGVAFPEPDLSNCGGVSVWLKVARLAEAANLPVTSTACTTSTSICWPRCRTRPISRCTASASSVSWPSRCEFETVWRSRPSARATGSSSTGRGSRRCARTEPRDRGGRRAGPLGRAPPGHARPAGVDPDQGMAAGRCLGFRTKGVP